MSKDFKAEKWKNIENHNLDFILSKNQLKILLEKIGNSVDEEGYIIDRETKERVQTNDFDEITVKKLGAILPGSKVFIKKNIASFSQYLSERIK